MNISKKLLFCVVAITAANVINVTKANAVNYFADAGLSMKQVDFKVQNSTGSGSYSLNPFFSMLSVTGGAVINRYYVTASLEQSLFDSKLDDAVYSGDKDTLSRSDNSITAGYYIKNNISVFAGFLTGETKDDYSSPSISETGHISFSEKGPFVGGNYLFLFSKGALSLNFAYAFLKGKYEESWNNTVGPGRVNYSGDTSGVSLGAKYVGQWRPKLNWYAGGKINLFKFKSDQFETDENFYIAQAGVTYKF